MRKMIKERACWTAWREREGDVNMSLEGWGRGEEVCYRPASKKEYYAYFCTFCI